ncbi:THUMP domain containing 3 [Nesidiocoris tenuis]|uniref:THUMP domain containing 3 n=1 Tax=Nesidiocoris tenuis TaxID=355587 RepID=A0ABN7AIB1_9HEMI|nr:THUMP domain containing 3 [Nesidiocoris tenuis]
MSVSFLVKLVQEAKAARDVITIEATVPTGLEFMASEECREKCKPISCFRGVGRIFMNINKDSYSSVAKLRSVDNVFMVTEAFGDLEFTWRKEEDLAKIKGIVDKVDWDKSVHLWAEIKKFEGVIFPECGEKIPATVQIGEGLKCHRCRGPENTPEPSVDAVSEGIVKPAPAEVQIILPEVITSTQNDESSVGTEPVQVVIDPDPNLEVHGVDGVQAASNLLSVGGVPPNPESDEDAFFSAEEDDVKLANLNRVPLGEHAQSGITSALRSETISAPAVSAQETVTEASGIPDDCSETDKPDDMTAVGMAINERAQAANTNDKKPDQLNSKEPKIVKMRKERKEKKKRQGNKRAAKQPKAPPKPYVDDSILKFRVTCYRNGKESHSFDSNAAAGHFGGTINDYFHWTVDLTRYDINVVLVIEDSSAYVSYGLTDSSFHRRNLTLLGPTSLRATMCYSLIRMAQPRVGDIIIDPLCGGGSIPIEGALGFPGTFHVCGDHHERAMARTCANIQHNIPINVDAAFWNATSLPLKDQSIDILVTDLPFGLRMGRNKDNRYFYGKVLREFGRIIRCTGRAVFLTYDLPSFIKASEQNSDIWRVMNSRRVNHGGLRCTAFLLMKRSTDDAEIQPKISSKPTQNEPKMSQERSVDHAAQPEMCAQRDSSDESQIALETLRISDSKTDTQADMVQNEKTD